MRRPMPPPIASANHASHATCADTEAAPCVATGPGDAPADRTRWPMPPLITASLGVHALAAGAALVAPEMAVGSVAALALNHALLSACGLWPRSTALGPNLSRLPALAAARGAVALTLDDGPDPQVTPPVLDWLDEHGVCASF